MSGLIVMSGGQSGVDRAALDAAIACGIPYYGYVPHSGKCEDLPDGELLSKYPMLTPVGSDDYRMRTRLNVLYSDTTIIITANGQLNSAGSRLTASYCDTDRRPYAILTPDDADGISETLRYALRSPGLGGHVRVNFAGNRESKHPGIYQTTYTTLTKVFNELRS